MKNFLLTSLSAVTIMSGINMAEAKESSNPLLQPSTLPYGTMPFDKITPTDYEEAVKEGMRQQLAEIEAIVNNSEAPTFENTIVAYDRSGATLMLAELALSNVEHATGDTILMRLNTELTPLLSEHFNKINLNPGLFKRIKSVYDSRNQRTDLNAESQRLIEIVYKGFENSGANLSDADRKKYSELSTELSKLNLRFSQNVTNGMSDSTRRLWTTLDQLEGMPQSIIDAARHEAIEILKAEGKVDDGSKYLFTVFAPSYSPFMKYNKNRDLRKQMYVLYNSRNRGGEFDNERILIDIANIRLEIAKLFGKKNFAEYQLQETMAGTPQNVLDFLKQLRDAYKEPMLAELAEVEEFAKKIEGPDFKLEAWDYSFYADKLKNEKYAFNDEDMKPYFELNNTINGVFGLATKLYGYKFKENKNIPGYHPDVRAYDVLTSDGKSLGLLYTDFFYRPGKAPGAWETEFRGESKNDEGVRNLPIISIVMNFSKPVGNEAVLLTPYEVETFLHEFGHALHALSAQSKYAGLAGTNVYHDFVELFSQFNENYLPEKKFLDGFAKHYKTGKKMPQELLDKFVRSQQFGAAYACMRQLNFGELDMSYHTIEQPLRASTDLDAFEAKALEPVRIFDAAEGCLISPSFSHVFSGGYAAGYYGYKWAEVLDADAFAAFQENGIFDKKTAAKFKKMLESGGSVDPTELYIEFRGKKANVDALLKRDGITK